MPQAVAPTQPTIVAPKGWVNETAALRESISGMPIGKGWSIKIVPPDQWRGPEQRPDQTHPPHAYSDLTNRITYLRGDAFHDLSAGVMRRMLAHELGHLTLNTSDEGRANKWADTWLKQNK